MWGAIIGAGLSMGRKNTAENAAKQQNEIDNVRGYLESRKTNNPTSIIAIVMVALILIAIIVFALKNS